MYVLNNDTPSAWLQTLKHLMVVSHLEWERAKERKGYSMLKKKKTSLECGQCLDNSLSLRTTGIIRLKILIPSTCAHYEETNISLRKSSLFSAKSCWVFFLFFFSFFDKCNNIMDCQHLLIWVKGVLRSRKLYTVPCNSLNTQLILEMIRMPSWP